jgi:DNA transformation protein
MNTALLDHCLELLAPLGAVRAQRMFGGHGLYCDDLFFGLIAADRLYLKVGPESLAAFVAAGSERFVYEARGKSMAMGYWTAPPEAMESRALMQPWGRLALAAALRARVAKASAAPRRKSAARAQTQAGTARRGR